MATAVEQLSREQHREQHQDEIAVRPARAGHGR
jgi:hypothetical protein